MVLSCPHCGQSLQLAAPTQGDTICCPSCSGVFSIPAVPQGIPAAVVTGPDETTRMQGAGVLMSLCVLSILWSLFGILRGLFYEAFALASETNTFYWRGPALLLLNAVTFLSAITMMRGKYQGLITYTIAQGLNVLVIVYTSLIYSEHMGLFSMLFGAFFFLPPVTFMLLFWLPAVTRNLSRTV